MPIPDISIQPKEISLEVTKECLSEYRKLTSVEVFTSHCCAVCAEAVFESKTSLVPLDTLPAHSLLLRDSGNMIIECILVVYVIFKVFLLQIY